MERGGGPSQKSLELGEGHLDGVEVGRVWRQEEQSRPTSSSSKPAPLLWVWLAAYCGSGFGNSLILLAATPADADCPYNSTVDNERNAARKNHNPIVI